MILDKIVKTKLESLEQTKELKPLDILLSEIPTDYSHRSFSNAIVLKDRLAIIAEIKKASPSKGIIKENFDPLKIAVEYEKNKVDAISVLTETTYFLGNNQFLTDAKTNTTVPVLRKDFIIDSYQIYEAKAINSDAILLIMAILTKEKLSAYINIATSIGLECLVEVHDIGELEVALECGAQIIGINNRNLNTFEVNIMNTEIIMEKIPKDIIVVSESGIKSNEDIKYLKDLGVNAALIGESLMAASSIEKKLQELREL
ncbi:indole-3-glycerol phosphate synthase TrpC [Alkalibaculum sp. M08DMB]|uniref:Indole-3-glycerol phosphate synthase n=1 Tax=Alkalibaculum sporogenes TaxID=2655001 RepID=A0A6A7KCH1_9FIRM|nr:indole-3-glycerol phosphate synthase TrpC [Alkalibaculum sporogenes]MPW26713.1 indole-3-glycerol phosphate synthase TrpC [Alkalibaculum sporogenes]